MQCGPGPALFDTAPPETRACMNHFIDETNSNRSVEVSQSRPLPVAGTVSGTGYSASASFTRPADTNAYAALDVVADSTSAPTVLTFSGIGPTGGKILIDQLTLEIDVGSVPSGMGAFRLHLFNAAPTAINDNAAFNLPSGDRAKYLGYIETPTPVDLGDTLWSETEGMGFPVRKQVTLVTAALYGILQTQNAYTPTSGAVKKATLHALRLE
jgi:hypothetical protein